MCQANYKLTPDLIKPQGVCGNLLSHGPIGSISEFS